MSLYQYDLDFVEWLLKRAMRKIQILEHCGNESAWIVDLLHTPLSNDLKKAKYCTVALCENWQLVKKLEMEDDDNTNVLDHPHQESKDEAVNELRSKLQTVQLIEYTQPKSMIQIWAQTLAHCMTLQTLETTFEKHPDLLGIIFEDLLNEIDSVAEDGSQSMLRAHVWIIALMRVLKHAKFLTHSLSGIKKDWWIKDNHVDNWLMVLCQANMYQTLSVVWRHNPELFVNRWCNMVDMYDVYGGPIGRACLGSLRTAKATRASETVRTINAILHDCMAKPEMRAKLAIDAQYLQRQWSGVALMCVTRTLEDPNVIESVVIRILEWCERPLMNVLDSNGYTALAYVVKHGGTPATATRLVQNGASLLIEVDEEEFKQGQQLLASELQAKNGLKTAYTLRLQSYYNERALLRRLIKEPKCSTTTIAKRLKTYNAAWAVKQDELLTLMKDKLGRDPTPKPADLLATSPYLRIHVTNLGVTPRPDDCVYVLTCDEQQELEPGDISKPRMIKSVHERQRARLMTGMELQGAYSGRIYDQYELEPHEAWLVRQPQVTTIVPGMLTNVQVIMQNPNPFMSDPPSTVLITLVGTGNHLDPFLPDFTPITLVFHTRNYCNYSGIGTPSVDEIHEEAAGITKHLGYEAYMLGNEAGFFRAEKAASGAAAMPFKLAVGIPQDTMNDKTTASSETQSIEMGRFVQVIHWVQDPTPRHVAIARMNIASCVAPVDLEIKNKNDDQPKQEADAEVPEKPNEQKNIGAALNFSTIIFDITIISRLASDIMECQLTMQEDHRLEQIVALEDQMSQCESSSSSSSLSEESMVMKNTSGNNID